MDFGLPIIAAIVVIAYFVGSCVKNSKINDKWIPEICAATGGVFGILAFIIHMPDFPANDIITALAIGIASGFAAVGINQVKKQLGKTE